MIILLISTIELLVFVFSKSITSNAAVYWQLAARYSARITFYILCIILFWTGIKGLKNIYANEKTRILLINLFALLAINHLIHFYFIYKNFEINNYEWFKAKHIAGSIVYPILVITPLYLGKQKIIKSP